MKSLTLFLLAAAELYSQVLVGTPNGYGYGNGGPGSSTDSARVCSAGNYLIAIGNPTGPTFTIASTGGSVTWTSITNFGAPSYIVAYYALCASTMTLSTTATVNPSGGGSFWSWHISQWSGLASPPVDTVMTAGANGAHSQTNAGAATRNGDLLLAYGDYGASTTTMWSPLTSETGSFGGGSSVSYQVIAAKGAFVWNMNGGLDHLGIALKAAGGGPPAAPTITTVSLPGGYNAIPYSQTLAATSTATPLTWSVTSGSLPSGVTLNASTGVLFGRTATGTYSFTVTATDSFGQTGSQALSLTIGANTTAPTNLRVAEKPNTSQVHISYDKPSPSSVCAVYVSTSPTYSPVIPDVDPTLYAGSNLDTVGLPAVILTGSHVDRFLGLRSAPIALNGRRYSRALQADTQHFAQLVCDGTSHAEISFTTETILPGYLYLEPPPGDPANPGQYSEPNIPVGDRTTVVVDPIHGMGATSMTLLDDAGTTQTGQAVVSSGMTITSLAAWTLTGGTVPATVSGSTGKLLIHIPIPGYNPDPRFQSASGYGMRLSNNPFGGVITSLDWVTAQLRADINEGGSQPSNPLDAQADTCLALASASPTTCDNSSAILTIPLNTVAKVYALGTGQLADLWRQTYGVGIPPWSVQAASQVNLLVWKHTTSSDTLKLLDLSVTIKTGSQPGGTQGGGYNNCSGATVIGPDVSAAFPGGEPGYICTTQGSLQYFVGAYTLTTHYAGSNAVSGCLGVVDVYYDTTGPTKFFCADNGGNLYQIAYTGPSAGQWADFGIVPSVNANNAFNMPACGSSVPCVTKTQISGTGSDLLTLMQNFMAGAPISLPAPAAFDKTQFIQIGHISNSQVDGKMMFTFNSANAGVCAYNGGNGYACGYNTNGYFFWTGEFDPHITSNASGGTSSGSAGNGGCIGGGIPGCIVAAMPSYNRPGCAFCTYKGQWDAAGGWAVINNFFNTQDVYQVQVIDGTADGSINAIPDPSTASACPTSSKSAFKCVQLTVSSQPFCNPVTNVMACLGNGASGTAGNLQIDQFLNNTEFEGQGSAHGLLRILGCSGCDSSRYGITVPASTISGAIIVVVELGANHVVTQTGALPVLYMQCNASQNEEINTGPESFSWWNFAAYPYGYDPVAPHLNAVPSFGKETGAHAIIVNGQFSAVSCAAQDTRCAGGIYSSAGSSLTIPGGMSGMVALPVLPSITSEYFPFNGEPAAFQPNIQAHFGGGWSTPYYYDAHPFQGLNCTASISCSGGGADPANICTNWVGQRCKFDHTARPLNLGSIKISPIGSYSGTSPIINISGPVSFLPTDSTGSYEWCDAKVSGECDPSSTAGDLYVNVPYMPNFGFCPYPGQNFTKPDTTDICITSAPKLYEGVEEVSMNSLCPYCGARHLTSLTGSINRTNVFETALPTTNGKGLIFNASQTGDGSAQNMWMMGRIPRWKESPINGGTWYQIPIFAYHLGASSAEAVYGYAENGNIAAGQFFGSGRRENSIAALSNTTTLGSSADPFWFELTDTWSPVPCTSGCVINVNAIPMRVLYYKIRYRDGSGNIIYTTPIQAMMTP